MDLVGALFWKGGSEVIHWTMWKAGKKKATKESLAREGSEWKERIGLGGGLTTAERKKNQKGLAGLRKGCS